MSICSISYYLNSLQVINRGCHAINEGNNGIRHLISFASNWTYACKISGVCTWNIFLNIDLNQVFIINILWPSYAILCQRSWSILAPVMPCYVIAPSHYLNQCWLIIKYVFWHTPQTSCIGSAQDIDLWNKSLKIHFIKSLPQLSETMVWVDEFAM